jgi:GYF domain 2
MKYYIQRQLNEYGPYTLADLQRYVAQGSILLTDLTRSEGMTEWTPVSQVLGNIPIPAPVQPGYAPGTTTYGGGTVYAGGGNVYGGGGGMPSVAAGPVPPDFHWALVLLIGFVTCGLFWWVWWIVEAAFIRKVKSDSKGLLFVVLSMVSYFTGGFLNGLMRAMNPGEVVYLGVPFSLIGFVLFVIAEFQMKNDLEDYYNTVEPINLRLHGGMTFFFAVWYFQYHLSRIAQWKKSGFLQPQN